MAVKDCTMIPLTTEIDARPLPLRDASTTPLYFCPNLCAYVCLYVSVLLDCVCMCECVCVTPKTAVLVRALCGMVGHFLFFTIGFRIGCRIKFSSRH